ncbi:hypothetical protein [Streptomyces sp. BA2]|uniref:hypothetical protein n=1 Tax=Streptomyces sp. BA2 TaxID=436595 RepID=UPI00192319C2|nr:hypothetical protein [Streptomyces sp. BA2]
MTAATRLAALDSLLGHVAERLVADEQHVEARVAVVDGRDTLAAVIIRPATGTNGEDSISVEANANGISKAVVAYALRQTADQFDAAARADGDEPITADEATAEQRARDVVASPPRALLAATDVRAAVVRGLRSAKRPSGLDALLAVAANMAAAQQAAEEAPALTVADVRDALDFNADDRDQVLATLRDVLLDTTATRTPEQALGAARIILTAHAQQLAALVEAEHAETRTRWGLNRSTRGLLTGYSNARRTIRTYADRLADEQALAEGAANEQVER